MPSPLHDTVNQLFRDRPALAVEILHDLLGMDVPTDMLVRLESNDFNDRPSNDFQPDVAVSVGPQREPVHAVIVETQQRALKAKRKKLARYAAALWLMLDCKVTVLCICPKAKVARFYAEPIPTQLPGYVLQTVVLGPDEVPVITDPAEVAKRPEVAALSVMMHGRRREVVETFAQGLVLLEPGDASQLYEYAFRMSGLAAQELFGEIMSSTTWPVYSPFAKEHFGRGKAAGREEGVAEGEAKFVLRALAARGIEVPDDVRARIRECTDERQLETWLDRAVIATSVDDLID